ncbi:hypothetical protein GCM10027597_27690 [Saccharopolyspora tripterygii]
MASASWFTDISPAVASARRTEVAFTIKPIPAPDPAGVGGSTIAHLPFSGLMFYHTDTASVAPLKPIAA